MSLELTPCGYLVFETFKILTVDGSTELMCQGGDTEVLQAKSAKEDASTMTARRPAV